MFRNLFVAAAMGGLMALPLASFGAEKTESADARNKNLKPYPLKTCVVSGEKFGGEMGEPYLHKYKDRQLKFCCKGCLKDFNKDPEKHVKVLEAAEKKGAK